MPDSTEATNESTNFRQWLTTLLDYREKRTGHRMDRGDAKTAYKEYFENGDTPKECLNSEWSYA